jgi:hypothetical protein
MGIEQPICKQGVQPPRSLEAVKSSAAEQALPELIEGNVRILADFFMILHEWECKRHSSKNQITSNVRQTAA